MNNQDTYTIAGRRIECPHCSCLNFDRRRILLNTRGLTFFSFDWLNRGATALVCRNCSRVELFQEEPKAE
ncbi:MAG TPA: DNA-binding protein [Lacunisphaera sp.]|nr:DNA-binding protein [Lacunisphaera sp.]